MKSSGGGVFYFSFPSRISRLNLRGYVLTIPPRVPLRWYDAVRPLLASFCFSKESLSRRCTVVERRSRRNFGEGKFSNESIKTCSRQNLTLSVSCLPFGSRNMIFYATYRRLSCYSLRSFQRASDYLGRSFPDRDCFSEFAGFFSINTVRILRKPFMNLTRANHRE